MPLEVYVYKLLLKCRAASQESGKVVLEAASITWQMGRRHAMHPSSNGPVSYMGPLRDPLQDLSGKMILSSMAN